MNASQSFLGIASYYYLMRVCPMKDIKIKPSYILILKAFRLSEDKK